MYVPIVPILLAPKHSIAYVASVDLAVVELLEQAALHTEPGSDKELALLGELIYLYSLPAVRTFLGL